MGEIRPHTLRTIDVLVLCSANICRSPMAEAILRARLRAAGITDVTVSSAGFLTEGREVAQNTVRILEERNVPTDDLTASVRVSGEQLGRSDLIICMAREHVREAVVLNKYAFGRVYPLKELVRRAAETGPRWSDESFSTWLSRIADERSPADYLGDSAEDDVEDPVGAPARIFRRTYKELDELLRQLIDLAWPSPLDARGIGPDIDDRVTG